MQRLAMQKLGRHTDSSPFIGGIKQCKLVKIDIRMLRNTLEGMTNKRDVTNIPTMSLAPMLPPLMATESHHMAQ